MIVPKKITACSYRHVAAGFHLLCFSTLSPLWQSVFNRPSGPQASLDVMLQQELQIRGRREALFTNYLEGTLCKEGVWDQDVLHTALGTSRGVPSGYLIQRTHLDCHLRRALCGFLSFKMLLE
jgi:hypothetical protein